MNTSETMLNDTVVDGSLGLMQGDFITVGSEDCCMTAHLTGTVKYYSFDGLEHRVILDTGSITAYHVKVERFEPK